MAPAEPLLQPDQFDRYRRHLSLPEVGVEGQRALLARGRSRFARAAARRRRMAKSKIPNPLERRHLIEKDLSDAQALETADAYLAAGRPVEAVDFLSKAHARERLAELRSRAIEAGDVFLLRAVARAMEEPPARTEWSAIADAAAAAGKERYAVEARRQLGRADDE